IIRSKLQQTGGERARAVARSFSPPAAARKKRKRGFSGTPRTPAEGSPPSALPLPGFIPDLATLVFRVLYKNMGRRQTLLKGKEECYEGMRESAKMFSCSRNAT